MRTKKGFTLIELLVVIAIIGLLSSVVLASLNTARQKSRDARRQSDLGQLKVALALYFDTAAGYPIQATAVKVNSTDAPVLNTALVPAYIAILPDDPLAAGDYYYIASATEYCVGANMEGSVPANNFAACVTALGNGMNYALGEGDGTP